MSRRDLGNKAFSALLASILLAFLVAVAILLLSNVLYLAQAGRTQGTSGWALFVEGLQDPANHFAIKLSLLTATMTALLSLIIGVPAAYVLSRYRLPGSAIIDTIIDLPIVLPPPVIGLSLLILFSTPPGRLVEGLTPEWIVDAINKLFTFVLGQEISDGTRWAYTTRGIILAQFFVACSFGVRAMKAAFDTIGTRHEDVARTLGCTRSQAYFRVVLPMARTGLIAGTIMTWARAMAEFGPILFFCGVTQGRTSVMPVQMFLHFSIGDIERAVVLVLIMLVISAVTLVTFKKLGGRGYLW